MRRAPRRNFSVFFAPVAAVGAVIVPFVGALTVAFACGGCASVPPLPPKANELNRQGAAALAAGDLTAAEARLQLALEFSPRFTEAWVNLGLVELRRGNLDLAYQDETRARDLNPDVAAPHHALGLIADRRGLGEEAERHYRAALKVDPGFAPARLNLGRRLFARGAYDDAREQFFRLTQVEPNELVGWVGLGECYLRLDRDGEADESLARARAKFGDRPELVLLVARQLLRRGAYAEAERVLEPLTNDREATRASAAWAWIGVCRLARGDRAGAQEAADESLAFDRASAVAAYVRSASGGGEASGRVVQGATHLGSSVPQMDTLFAPDSD
jgi:tetratricopeptide (TPR) repeat protein